MATATAPNRAANVGTARAQLSQLQTFLWTGLAYVSTGMKELLGFT